MNTRSGTTRLSTSPITRATPTVTIAAPGTPRPETRPKTAGACPAAARPNSVRPMAKVIAFSAEKAAMMTTAFRTWAAAGRPTASMIWTKGDCSPVMPVHGARVSMTPTEPT